MPTEAQLQHLYRQLTEALDVEGADTLMDIVSPMARNELATKTDLVALRSDLVMTGSNLRVEVADLRSELRGEMSALGTELRAEMTNLGTELRAEMASLGSDLRGEMANLRGELFRMMLVTQGATVAILGLLITFR